LSNITAGSGQQVQRVIESGSIPILINIARNDEKEVAEEAIWALTNCTASASSQQLQFLLNN